MHFVTVTSLESKQAADQNLFVKSLCKIRDKAYPARLYIPKLFNTTHQYSLLPPNLLHGARLDEFLYFHKAVREGRKLRIQLCYNVTKKFEKKKKINCI